MARELLKPLLAPDESEAPDPKELVFGWEYLGDAPAMPEGFSWVRIAERYRKSLTTQQILSEDLRGQLDSRNLERIRGLLEGQFGVPTDADEARYARRMREKYRVLDFSAMLPLGGEGAHPVDVPGRPWRRLHARARWPNGGPPADEQFGALGSPESRRCSRQVARLDRQLP